MEIAKVTSKGQITIPVSIRRRLKINEGDKLLFIDRPDGVMMVNPDLLESAHTTEEPAIDKSSQAKASYSKPVTDTKQVKQSTSKTQLTQKKQDSPIQQPPAPPTHEKPKPETNVSGFNLDALLDEIRSIGSIRN